MPTEMAVKEKKLKKRKENIPPKEEHAPAASRDGFWSCFPLTGLGVPVTNKPPP
jgi:hypothetical protein